MNKFGLVVEYGTGRSVMLTDTPDIFIALNKFYNELKKSLPGGEYKDFALPTILSCEIIPVKYDNYKENKKFALITQYKYGKSIMITDAYQLDKAISKLVEEKQKELPEDYKNSTLVNVLGCELLPVLYESVYE